MLIHDHIKARIVEPGGHHPSVRFLQDRDFFTFRNTRAILLHKPTACPSHDIVIESFAQLRAYHQDSFHYTLAFRNTYNLKTYATFLGIVNDVHEPLTSACSMLDYRPFALQKLSNHELQLRGLWAASPLNAFKRGLPPKVLFDCIACDKGNVHAAIVTSTPVPLTEQFLKDFASNCNLAYFYYSQVEDAVFKDQWYRVFNTRSKRVQMYVGVGGNEFGEPGSTCSVLPPPFPNDHKLVQMCRAAAASDRTQLDAVRKSEGFAQAAALAAPPDIRAVAEKLGIRLLVRYNMRYFMLR